MVEINALSKSLFTQGIAYRFGFGGGVCVQPESPQIKTPLSWPHRTQEQFGNAYLPVNFVQGAKGIAA
jgi:hypothetical protein